MSNDGMQKATLRHALVVVAGILILLGPCALTYNTWAIFVVPVSTSLGCTAAQFTFYVTLVYLASALSAPLVGNLMERVDLRVVFAVSVVLTASGIFLCSLWTEPWQFYLSGVIEGVGIVSLMFLAVPTLVNRWFNVRIGFLIGLCMAMSGLGGAVWSMVGGVVMDAAGWREAYVLYAVLVLAMALPASIFFVRSHPHEVGLKPVGAPLRASEDASCALDELVAQQSSVPAKVMFKSPVFFALMVSMGLYNALTAVGNLFATYIYHLADQGLAGLTPGSAVLAASTVAACLMVAAAVGKVSLGALTDKSGRAAILVVLAAGVASILLFWLATGWSASIYVGAVLFGFVYAAVDALGPSLTRKIVGPRDYTVIYARIAIVVNVGGAVAVTLFTMLAEFSWTLEWVVTIALIVLTTTLALYAVRAGKSLPRTME